MSGRLGLRKKKKERGKTGENHDTIQTSKHIIGGLRTHLMTCCTKLENTHTVYPAKYKSQKTTFVQVANRERKQTKLSPQPRLAQVNHLNLSTRTSNPSLWNLTTSTNTRSYSWMTSPQMLGPLTCALKMLHSQQQSGSSLW